MPEWWTYRPSDFLMFSARTWDRLVQGWNDALWPWQAAFVPVGLLLLAAAWRDPYRWRGWALAVTALAWAGVAWGFHWERFAQVNTGATAYAAAFALQAALLLVRATALGTPERPSLPLRVAGLAVGLAALLAYPLLGPLALGSWRQAELAGAMPDPTALFTVGLLLVLPERHRAWLLVIPLLALAVGWTTAWLLRAG